LRFRLTGSDQVKKVKHILDPIESILKWSAYFFWPL
jgi:hypothetical protein